MSHQSFPKIILKRDRVLGSQIIKDNEIGSGDWEGPLLKEIKSEVYTMRGASDLSPRQTLVAMRDGGTRTTK